MRHGTWGTSGPYFPPGYSIDRITSCLTGYIIVVSIMADMMRPIAPPNLPGLVKAAFDKARASGEVSYYPTQVAVLTPGSIPVSILPVVTAS